MRKTIDYINFNLFTALILVFMVSCSSNSQMLDRPFQPPEVIQYAENENTAFFVNATCFRLAEKVKLNFDNYLSRQKEEFRNQLFVGALDCTSEPTGQFAFISLYFSKDQHDSSKMMTGPAVVAETQDGAKTFKWSLN